MIVRTFDPMTPYRCVVYGRMSSDKQNPRSPDQQFELIDREIAARRLPWFVVKRYRDDGISGRYFLKRDGLQEMLRDIRMGSVTADLLLLDTRERLGRSDDLGPMRKELADEHGIYIVTADTGFCDPTSSTGRIVGAFEEVRAVDSNRVKAHEVLRGKMDSVRRKLWPGGKPPRGLMLQTKFMEVNGRQEKEGSILIPEPEFAFVVKLMFDRADATGHGQARIARYLNESPEVPAKFKPIPNSTVGNMLDSELYFGQFHFPKHCTDIVSEIRIREKNKREDILIVDDFCEPIVSRELWERVHAVRDARRARIQESRGNRNEVEKFIQPLAPGISIKHLLSGLVRCGQCGAAMVPGGMSYKKDPSGKYIYFRCPRRIDGACNNKQSVPVKWLTETVVGHVEECLLGIAQ